MGRIKHQLMLHTVPFQGKTRFLTTATAAIYQRGSESVKETRGVGTKSQDRYLWAHTGRPSATCRLPSPLLTQATTLCRSCQRAPNTWPSRPTTAGQPSLIGRQHSGDYRSLQQRPSILRVPAGPPGRGPFFPKGSLKQSRLVLWLLLRGTVFTPDSDMLIVSRMEAEAPPHLTSRVGVTWGRSQEPATPRHLVISPDGEWIYEFNKSGHVSKPGSQKRQAFKKPRATSF